MSPEQQSGDRTLILIEAGVALVLVGWALWTGYQELHGQTPNTANRGLINSSLTTPGPGLEKDGSGSLASDSGQANSANGDLAAGETRYDISGSSVSCEVLNSPDGLGGPYPRDTFLPDLPTIHNGNEALAAMNRADNPGPYLIMVNGQIIEKRESLHDPRWYDDPNGTGICVIAK